MGSEIDSPGEGSKVQQDLGDEEGAEARHPREGGWNNMLLAGVLPADDPPLSRVNPCRAESGSEGNGTDSEASGSPVSGDLQVCCFPFLTPAAHFSCTCAVQDLRKSSAIGGWQSIFPVFGFFSIRLHFCFFTLHLLQGPIGSTSQKSPDFSHQLHCHSQLAWSQLKGWWHTINW